jgi:hypothetical protein
MELMDMKKLGFPVLGLLGLLALSGCGAVNSAINSVIPEIDNLVRLDDSTADAVVGSGRAVISGNVNKSITFDDRTLPQSTSLKRMRLRQSLDQDIQVTPAGDAALPVSFTLKNITLSIRLGETSGNRVAEASASFAGPVTFTRQAGTSVYRTATPVEVSNITFDTTNFNAARDIITSAPSPNTAAGRLSFDAESTELPSGTSLRFKFTGGKAKLEL